MAFDCVVNISWRERGDSIKTASTQSKAKLKSLLNTKLKAKAQISTAQFTNQAQVTEFVVNKGNGLKCLSETRIKALLDQYIQPFEDQHQGRVLWKSQKVLTLGPHINYKILGFQISKKSLWNSIQLVKILMFMFSTWIQNQASRIILLILYKIRFFIYSKSKDFILIFSQMCLYEIRLYFKII